MPELNTTLVLNYLNAIEPNPQRETIRKWMDVFYEVSLHTKGVRPRFKDLSIENGGYITPPRWLGHEYQDIFDRYLMTRHPREPEITRQWRYSQYRPFTKAPFGMLTDILRGAIFQDSQYTLTLPEKEDNDYIWNNNFLNKNLITYCAEILLPALLEDPNGYIVRIPSKPWYEQTAPRVDIDIFFVNSKDLVFVGKSDVVFKRNNYAYWITENAIMRYAKTDGSQYELDGRGYYATMLGRLPASIAGGIWNTEGYYDSYYDKAVPAANEFISSFSAEQMVDKEASHPWITQIADDCDECHGIGEVATKDYNSGTSKTISCPKCKGRKTVSVNPADRIQISLEDWEKVPDGGVRINTPDTSVNKYHRDKNTQIMEMILRALNLLNIDAAQSGTAKSIDLEKLHTFISAVSNNIFDNIIYPIIRDIIAYRNVQATPTGTVPYVYDFTLIKPTQFQIKTAADLLLELTESTKGNIPGYIRKKQVAEFVDKRFAGDDVFQRKTEVIAELDDLYVYTPDERMTMRTTGEIDLQDLIFSRKLPGILDTLIRERGTHWFKGAKIDEIKDLVDKLISSLLDVKEFALKDENGNTQNGVGQQPN
jgi:hypothetical protein